MGLKRETLQELIFGAVRARRHTQDSPVVPDVWIAFNQIEDNAQRVDLLLTPRRETTPGGLALAVEKRVDAQRARIAYNEFAVATGTTFYELLGQILPLSSWWETRIERDRAYEALSKRTPRTLAALAKDVADPKQAQRRDLIWLLRVAAAIEWARGKPEGTFESEQPSWKELLEQLFDGLGKVMRPPTKHRRALWLVSHNREAFPAIWRSTTAIKADAAVRLFDISCRNIAWAVLDSGIDANHPAFATRDARNKVVRGSRVVATYDFTRVRELLSLRSAKTRAVRPEELRRSLISGRAIDWGLLEPVLAVPHDARGYRPPVHEHGTHVAGVLGACWRHDDKPSSGEHELVGVCPDIRLYDFRVLDDKGDGDEFALLAALQFIRHLNGHKERMTIQGANVSLSIRHEVANYACGRTPVCDEAERLVSTGVVVVAAAGNQGHVMYLTPTGLPDESYRSISITDPGNADLVITVGATHRYKPHTFGVSYFSSRGPTGDGRIKPDLVAPGEKIVSTVPGGVTQSMDGTSMAAPHVSGAAALLMARHEELMGQPARIKRILCESATNLGRERYFQGAGMLDVLRALQTV